MQGLLNADGRASTGRQPPSIDGPSASPCAWALACPPVHPQRPPAPRRGQPRPGRVPRRQRGPFPVGREGCVSPLTLQISPETFHDLLCTSPTFILWQTVHGVNLQLRDPPVAASPLPGHSWETGRAGTGTGRKEMDLLLLQPPPEPSATSSSPRSPLGAQGWRWQSRELCTSPLLQRTAALSAKPRKQGDGHLLPGHAPQHGELAPTGTRARRGRAMQKPVVFR